MIAVEWIDIEGITKMQYSFKEDTLKPIGYILLILSVICIFTGKGDLILIVPLLIAYGLFYIWPFLLVFFFICWLIRKENKPKHIPNCRGLHNPYVWVEIRGRKPNGTFHSEHWCPICKQKVV